MNLKCARTVYVGSRTLTNVLIQVLNKMLDAKWTRPIKTQCASKLPGSIYQTFLSSKTKQSSVIRVMKRFI